MEYISAPWRAKYVKNVFKMKGCVFCDALKIKSDETSYILHRGEFNFILLNKFPYTPGHLMVAPYNHMASIADAEKEATDELMDFLKQSVQVLKKEYNPQGFNTGMNLGKSAGAGVADHYHVHVIPRWIGDSNFMPIVGETKVVIETLDTTYKRLAPIFKKI